MKVHCLQHISIEDSAAIGEWLKNRGHQLNRTLLHEGGKLPNIDSFDLLVVMGGPMGVYQEELYPWLHEEKKFVREAIDRGKAVFGVCLGAQLIAAALGAEVYPGGRQEIGWYQLEFDQTRCKDSLLKDAPGNLNVLHWHGDTFDLPAGAVHLASSSAYQNQAFQVGDRVLGLQFHIECSFEETKAFVETFGVDTTGAEDAQSGDEILAESSHYQSNLELLDSVMEGFEALF